MTLHPRSSIEDTKRYRNTVTPASVQNGLLITRYVYQNVNENYKSVRNFVTSNQSQLLILETINYTRPDPEVNVNRLEVIVLR